MKRFLLSLIVIASLSCSLAAQGTLEVNGLCIAAPSHDNAEEFVSFVDEFIAPLGINTLILRVDFNYNYTSRPELRDDNPLTQAQVKAIVAVCRENGIRLIPQINLLGHQSWAEKVNKLLEVYPEFDETPNVTMPEKYEWPNDDGLYCKSYCPLHPEVHKVVFDLVDEIMEVFEADAFHAGMDEVFYLAEDSCPRCRGKDPAVLFAGEVTKISQHLEKSGARLWIWGDRLIDGSENGIGMWEGSTNQTAPAIDLIPTSVVIADWHYERPLPTPAYFALKGFDVVACSWRKPGVAEGQVEMMRMLKENSTPQMASRIRGVLHTVWSPADAFMEEFTKHRASPADSLSQAATLKAMTRALSNSGAGTN
jgi:hypothetical protein